VKRHKGGPAEPGREGEKQFFNQTGAKGKKSRFREVHETWASNENG